MVKSDVFMKHFLEPDQELIKILAIFFAKYIAHSESSATMYLVSQYSQAADIG